MPISYVANDPKLQRQILIDALRAFALFWAPGMMLTLPYVWDLQDTSLEKDFGPGFELYGVGEAMQEGFTERKLGRAQA